jgi:4-hydroxy-3-polyprenylbenzoate decarboxylase
LEKYSRDNTVALAVTGASGAGYSLRLLEHLIAAEQRVWLMLSDAGRIVMEMEESLSLPDSISEQQQILAELFGAEEGQLLLYGKNDWLSPAASGSSAARAMVVCPCSMGTLSSIAHGSSDNLLERAADVIIKERRELILVPRETPYSTIHLENMAKLSKLGVVILPPNPGFYQHPKSIQDLVDFIVARILDQLNIEHRLLPAWADDI